MHKENGDILTASLDELRALVSADSSQDQVDAWTKNNRSTIMQLECADLVIQLLNNGAHAKALMLFEMALQEKSAGRVGWVAGIGSFVPTAALVLLVCPRVGPFGVWFPLIFAAVGAVFFGVGFQTYRNPKGATIYTGTTSTGMTNMASGRQGKRTDGILFMGLSLLFFGVALAGGLVWSAFR
jgi:hypothetical protein